MVEKNKSHRKKNNYKSHKRNIRGGTVDDDDCEKEANSYLDSINFDETILEKEFKETRREMFKRGTASNQQSKNEAKAEIFREVLKKYQILTEARRIIKNPTKNNNNNDNNKKTYIKEILISSLGLALYEKYLQKKYREEYDALKKLIENPNLFDNIDKKYTKDKDFCLKAISRNIEVFNYINNNLIKNENFLLEAIGIQNNILSLMVKNKGFSEILKKSSFIYKLKKIKAKTIQFKLLVKDLDSDNNTKKDSHKKRTRSKRTSKKNTRY